MKQRSFLLAPMERKHKRDAAEVEPGADRR